MPPAPAVRAVPLILAALLFALSALAGAAGAARLRSHTAQAVEDSGQQELLNWMCLAGALAELKRRPAETEFIDTWIFNSSKCFLMAPPPR